MKNRIDSCFEELRARGEKALVTFITAGDPDMAATERLVIEMFDKGADIIELGVPFSDPIAEGKTIQLASQRSLKGGTTIDKIFDCVQKIRQETNKPLLLMMYVNTIFKYGTEKFFAKCKEFEIDGVIVPDLPFEEREEVLPYAEKYGIYNINLVAPTSIDRVNMIASESKGFLYVVSSLGVTGARKDITTDFDTLLAPLRDQDTVPCCIGFGISSPELAAKMSAYCDGVIVGSAIVNRVAENVADVDKAVGEVGDFTKSLKEVLK